ncbi:SusC/RagA family TonB-linked outer membrane protein [Fibrivirga algicola]|uniref:TonB-dependent receptor n=1 Tax=Fibrivirga algicola TaxID=2950420 RepID=A0ABX0QLF7_9BACT|nr:TonB-dependent receptor [Fibrivirga algicola]NID12096.1 TonB-dependent receptor [Fibrivirga algicola]
MIKTIQCLDQFSRKGINSTRLIGCWIAMVCFLMSSQLVLAQESQTVKGVVLDEQQKPLFGAYVILKNTTTGTTSDVNGEFTLKIPAGKQTLTVSYLGSKPQEVTVEKSGTIKVVLSGGDITLAETVVVGYAQQKKQSVVGAISQTTGKVLERAGGVYSVGSALTGNVPGVITTSSTGMPGEEDPRILIRGLSSWNNSSPLILVDGIERPMNSVDISSIETISVLKDASATAVFGVKGANGVILITTKRGKEGKANINVRADYTLKSPSALPNKFDSYDARRIRNQVIESELGLESAGWATYTPYEILNRYRNPANLAEAERYPNVDWAKEMFKPVTQSYSANLNVSGGTSFVKYFASADFLMDGDIFKEWDNNRGYQAGYGFNRINVRTNLDFQLTPTTLLVTNLSSSNGVKKSPWGATGGEYDMWQGAYSVAPDVMMPRYSDGTWGYYAADPVAATNSILNLARSGIMKRTTSRITTDFTLNQDLKSILNGLSTSGTVSWDNSFVESQRGINDLYNDPQTKWIDPVTGESRYRFTYDAANMFDFQEAIRWAPQAGAMDNGATYRRLFYQLKLNYNKTWNKHTGSAMGLFSREDRASGSEIPNYREDWVFRTTYDYAGKYFAEVNGAYNGSEKFGADNRFHFFSSGAVGWLLSEEPFLKPVKFLDLLKLRLSYGKIGDDNINQRWLYMTQWAYNGQAKIGENNSDVSPYVWYRESSVGNPSVHWESVTKTNLGADFSLFNGMVSGSLDFFNDYRTDILIAGGARAIPSYYGTSAPVANLGKVRVKGYEFEVKVNHQLPSGLRLWGNANMTHAKDQILEADNPSLLPDYRKTEGKQIGQTYSYVSHGYYNTWDELYGSTEQNTNDRQKLPGNLQIVDYNGDGKIDTYDNIPYGYPNRPQNTYNATVGFEWKGFSAFAQFYGVNNVTRQVVFTSFGSRLNTVYDQGTYWTKDNPTANSPLPRLMTATDGSTYGNFYMYDGSYVRLKNAEVAYTFNRGWVERFGVRTLRVYANGNNLWLWTKMPDDRESNFAGTGWAAQGAYPTVKRFNFGINITL